MTPDLDFKVTPMSLSVQDRHIFGLRVVKPYTPLLKSLHFSLRNTVMSSNSLDKYPGIAPPHSGGSIALDP